MGGELTSAVPPVCAGPQVEAAEAVLSWHLKHVAQLLSGLCQTSLSDSDVRDKAVGIGLLHARISDNALGLLALSRLLLAGYELPAAADTGTLEGLRRHTGEGRRAFVLLGETNGEADSPNQIGEMAGVFEVERWTAPLCNEDVVIQPTGQPDSSRYLMPVAAFQAAWNASGSQMVVAARSWDELAAVESTFFGGTRDPGDVLHWDAAECDTDMRGRLVRYYSSERKASSALPASASKKLP